MVTNLLFWWFPDSSFWASQNPFLSDKNGVPRCDRVWSVEVFLPIQNPNPGGGDARLIDAL